MSELESATQEAPDELLYSLDQICGNPTGLADGHTPQYTPDQVGNLVVEVGIRIGKVQGKMRRYSGLQDSDTLKRDREVLYKHQEDFNRLIALLPDGFLEQQLH